MLKALYAEAALDEYFRQPCFRILIVCFSIYFEYMHCDPLTFRSHVWPLILNRGGEHKGQVPWNSHLTRNEHR